MWQKVTIRNFIYATVVSVLILGLFIIIKHYAIPSDRLVMNMILSFCIFIIFLLGLIKSFFFGLRLQKNHTFILASISLIIYMMVTLLYLLIITAVVF